jgi:hypothetical protein
LGLEIPQPVDKYNPTFPLFIKPYDGSLSKDILLLRNSAGWTMDLVQDANCGYYVNPQRPEELVDTIRKLQNDPELCSLLGKNARKLAEKNMIKVFFVINI